MRYYFNVNGTEFNVSQLEITGLYRKESTQTNLMGELLIDRAGTEKLQISVKFNLLTEEQMTVLRAARAAVTCTVQFDRGNERIEKLMHISEYTEPSPIYLYGDKSKGIRYDTLTVKMEEM